MKQLSAITKVVLYHTFMYVYIISYKENIGQSVKALTLKLYCYDDAKIKLDVRAPVRETDINQSKTLVIGKLFLTVIFCRSILTMVSIK